MGFFKRCEQCGATCSPDGKFLDLEQIQMAGEIELLRDEGVTQIRIPTALVAHFLNIVDQAEDRMFSGCNDFVMADTPENRLIHDLCQAQNLRMPLEEYRQSDKYEPPNVSDGKIYTSDFVVFGLFKSYIQEAIR